MPSLPVILPWACFVLAALIFRVLMARHDSPEQLRRANVPMTRALWDDGRIVRPARVVVTGERLHVRPGWRPRMILDPARTDVLSPSGSAWQVDVGRREGALLDVGGSLDAALAGSSGSTPTRLTWRQRLFLHVPRWPAALLLASLVLAIGMAALTVMGERHDARVSQTITTPEESHDCVVSWPGKRAGNPQVTACPQDDAQRVGDTISLVRLPASDYVIALDETHLSYVGFLALASAVLFLLVVLGAALIPLARGRRPGTYTPRPQQSPPSSGHAETSPEGATSGPHPLTTPGGWLDVADTTSTEQPPAHSGTMRKRITWRFTTLPVPRFSLWLLIVAVIWAWDHRLVFVPVVVVLGLVVIVGLVRCGLAWADVRREPEASIPRSQHSYVRLPPEDRKKARSLVTSLLVFDEADHDGAWLMGLDGAPASAGRLEVVGTLEEMTHPRVAIDGIGFEAVGPPHWMDVDLLAEMHDDLAHHPTHPL